MKNIKKNISIIFISLFFITIITSAAAADDNNMTDTNSDNESQLLAYDHLYSNSEYAKNNPIRRLRDPDLDIRSVDEEPYSEEINIISISNTDNNNKTVKIKQPKTNASVNVDVDDSFKILGKLKANTIVFDENQTLINSGVVTYYLNDEVISTQNLNNGFSRLNYSLDQTKTAGRYLFKVTFTDDEYNSNEFSTFINIMRSDICDVTIPSQNIYSGEDLEIKADILDKTTNSKLLGNISATVVINGQPFMITDIVDGKVDVKIAQLTEGMYDIKLLIPESQLYNAKNITTTAKVKNRRAKMNVFIDSGNKTIDNMTIHTTVVDEDTNNPINGGIIEFSEDSVVIGDANVINGSADLSFENLVMNTGIYRFDVVYISKNYDVISKTKDIEITHKIDMKNISLDTRYVGIGEDLNINETLKDVENRGIFDDVVVEVFLDGINTQNMTITDSQMDISINTENLNSGVHDLKLNLIPQQDIYNPNLINSKIVVENATVSMDILTNHPKIGDVLDVNLFIIDYNMQNISGNVIFKLNGKTLKDENNNTIKLDVNSNILNFKYKLPSNIGAGNYI
ncbi:MAG: hypothetical protein SOZ23_03785 [Methanosphaera sp.]|uniref:hypothetical protein n=1 Tax=Methanosphaera sp. TaxID=2666342 RepID=UPI0025CBEF56|nr:hypothetical protein [Methanosphaera sp.]MCI5866931.1 hypothetical protein [Methanosphaera sp.]MDD6535086.1 hypothetical protein [Methanosphaera sp.]MDY3955896.1 hypothetical protein [Methanosphaera sp.]